MKTSKSKSRSLTATKARCNMSDFVPFAAWIVLLTVPAILSIVFERQLVAAEDKLRDYLKEKYNNNWSVIKMRTLFALCKKINVLFDVIQDQREQIAVLKKNNKELCERIKRRDELIAFYRSERTKGVKL